jgi:hypothetical protein
MGLYAVPFKRSTESPQGRIITESRRLQEGMADRTTPVPRRHQRRANPIRTSPFDLAVNALIISCTRARAPCRVCSILSPPTCIRRALTLNSSCSIVAPAVKVVTHRRCRGKVFRQERPRAARRRDILDCIPDPAQLHLSRTPKAVATG